MPQDTPYAAEPAIIRTRLQRLRELVELQADTDWARSYVQEILDQSPDSPDSRCPRFAGVITDGSNGEFLVADSEEQLAQLMSRAITGSDVCLAAEVLVDLDNGDRRLAYTTVTIAFMPTPSRVNAVPEQPPAQ
jgi:hypothetical protein